jgi:hypothetical protein
MDPLCPGLVVFDELVRKGWEKVVGKVVHSHISPLQWDGRLLGLSRKFYMQCCLGLQDTLVHSAGRMPSNQPMYYYRLLLAGIRTEAGLSGNDYRLVWKRTGRTFELQGIEDEPVAAPEPPAPPPLADGCPFNFVGAATGKFKPPPKKKAKVARTGVDDAPAPRPPRALGEPDPPLAAPPLPPPPNDPVPPVVAPPPPLPAPPRPPFVFVGPPAAEPLPFVGGGGERAVRGAGAGAAGVERGPRRQSRPWQLLVDGSAVARDTYQPPGDGAAFSTWFMRCPRHGNACFERREVRASAIERYGEAEVVAFLRVWAEYPCDPDNIDGHKWTVRETKARITDAAIDRWMLMESRTFFDDNNAFVGQIFAEIGTPMP